MIETARREQSQTVFQPLSPVEQVGKNFSYSDNEWYALYTVVRHEKTVDAALAEKNIDTFLPLRGVTNQWKDRRKRILLPLFPGYLFVNMPLQEMWIVLNTRGVVKILGVKGSPIPVPVEQICTLKRLLESNLKYDHYPYFSQGKEVVVVNGPLQGIRGRILERRGNYRLILSVDIIQRSVSVEVDIGDVELT